ncbi:hypothetical protein SLA2020_441450 [Shorea laevis]
MEKLNEVNQMGGGEKWRSLASFITVANIVYGRLTGKEGQIFSIVKELEQEIRCEGIGTRNQTVEGLVQN